MIIFNEGAQVAAAVFSGALIDQTISYDQMEKIN